MSDISTKIPMIDSNILAVQEANNTFYNAFETLDIQKMDVLWLKENYIKCIHPGWEIRSGWPDVRDSWVLIFNHTHEIRFSISLLDVVVKDNLAWAVCDEKISTKDEGKWLKGHVITTNIFERREGAWLLIHHHGSPVLTIEKEGKEGADKSMP